MDNKEAYNRWSSSYDQMPNATRDLAQFACKKVLSRLQFSSALELGSGTGFNTPILLEKADQVHCVDFSTDMMAIAKEKFNSEKLSFLQADLSKKWALPIEKVDLISSSLVFEHLADLGHIFAQAAQYLIPSGLFFLCELHPYKQYIGSKARFEHDSQEIKLQCYTHHLSDYTKAAKQNDFEVLELEEWFDEGNLDYPRLISLLFRRKKNG